MERRKKTFSQKPFLEIFDGLCGEKRRRVKVVWDDHPLSSIRPGEFTATRFHLLHNGKPLNVLRVSIDRYAGSNGVLFNVDSLELGLLYVFFHVVHQQQFGTMGGSKKAGKAFTMKKSFAPVQFVSSADAGTSDDRRLLLVREHGAFLFDQHSIVLQFMFSQPSSTYSILPFRIEARVSGSTDAPCKSGPVLVGKVAFIDVISVLARLIQLVSMVVVVTQTQHGDAGDALKALKKMQKDVEINPDEVGTEEDTMVKDKEFYQLFLRLPGEAQWQLLIAQSIDGSGFLHAISLLGYVVTLGHALSVGSVLLDTFGSGSTEDDHSLFSSLDLNGRTPLHYSVSGGSIAAVQLLVNYRVPTNVSDLMGETPKDLAVRERFDDATSLLEAGGDCPDVPSLRIVSSHKQQRGVLPSDLPIAGASLHQLSYDDHHEELSRRIVGGLDDVEAQDDEGATPLHCAAFSGAVGALRVLLTRGKARANAKDHDGRTALHKAAFQGHDECVRALLEHGADASAQDSSRGTALHMACLGGSARCMQMLLDASPSEELNRGDADGSTPMHKACYSGYAEGVRCLLRAKADPNQKDARGATPLHIGAYKSQMDACSVLLRLGGACVGPLDGGGATPLHHTCFRGDVPFTQLLLEHKADVNAQDEKGQTPMHNACFAGHADVVMLLLRHAATAVVPTRRGKSSSPASHSVTPLLHASAQGHVECVQALLDHYKDASVLDDVDHEGSTALHKAAYFGHAAVVQVLISHGARIDAQDSEGSTPLHKAAFSGKVECVHALLGSGAPVDCQDMEDGTPLHNAAFNGHRKVASALLSCNANLNAADSNGASPLHLAVLNGQRSTAMLLLAQGAPVDSQDDKEMTPLHQAVEHPECVLLLVEEDAEVDSVDADGHTPLYYAVMDGLAESVEILIVNGADPRKKSPKGRASPLDLTSMEDGSGMAEVIGAAEVQRAEILHKEYEANVERAVKRFNRNPAKGMRFMVDRDLIDGSHTSIARFLHGAKGLNRQKVGEYLSRDDGEEALGILREYADGIDFAGLSFDEALRKYLLCFRLPGEAQKIDRLMEAFAARYMETNASQVLFPNTDTCYLLAFSTIMLNTDLHSPAIRNKMTMDKWLRMNAGIAKGKDLPNAFLQELYETIKSQHIIMEAGDSSLFLNYEKKGWLMKQGGRIKSRKRRWFVLADNCLYYFKQPEDKKPQGIIPLADLRVRESRVKKKKHFAFELYVPLSGVASVPGKILSAKLDSNGSTVTGNHSSYHFVAGDEREMHEWIGAIKANICSCPIRAMMASRQQSQVALRARRDTAGKSGSRGTSSAMGPRPRMNTPLSGASSSPLSPPRSPHLSRVGGGGVGDGGVGGAAASGGATPLGTAARTSSKPPPPLRREEKAGALKAFAEDWRFLQSVATMCQTCYLDGKAIREMYGTAAVVVEPVRSVRCFVVKNKQKKAQRLIFVGMPWKRNASNYASRVQRVGVDSFDPYVMHKPRETAKTMFARVQKILKPSWPIEIGGHSMGGVVAMMVAKLCVMNDLRVASVLTFGQPRVFDPSGVKLIQDYAKVPLLRVISNDDPIPELFHNRCTIGKVVVLLRKEKYFYSSDPVSTGTSAHDALNALKSEGPAKAHTMEAYLRRIRAKVRDTTGIAVTHEERLSARRFIS